MANDLFFDTDDPYEEGTEFHFLRGRGLVISVSECKAVGDDNQSFTCRANLSREQAIELRDWLANEIASA